MSFQHILTQLANTVLTITINRPDKLNALNRATIEELHHAFTAANLNSEVRAVIITGSGEKAFVAGADISEFADFAVEQGKAMAADGHAKLFDLIENLNKPVIAAINGFALGGGLELAMAAHIRVASETKQMGLPEVTLGVIPGYGGTQRLAQLAGKGKALEMITTAAMITADEARACGLVNHVVPAATLLAKCEELAAKMVRNSSSAITSAIRAVNAGYKDGVNGFQVEIDEFGKCFGTADFKEGTTAFLEKRKACF